MKLYYRRALAYHARAVAALLRPEDATELRKLYPTDDPEQLLLSSVDKSDEAFVVTDEQGRYVLIGGVGAVHEGSTVGVPWMLATPLIKTYRKDAFRLAREGIRRWSLRFDVLMNAMDPANASARLLIKGLGFKEGAITRNLSGADVLPFIRYSNRCVTSQQG